VDQYLLFALLGLGSGALIAGIALGVVLTYRGSGIINLAVGAVAMFAGYIFWALRTGWFGPVFDTPPALVLSLIAALVMGALMELLAFRPLRTASPLAKMAASIGILLFTQGAMLLAFGTSAKRAPSILTNDTVEMFGVTVPINRFVLAGIVVAAACVLTVVYRWSRFGLATRAASESEVSAMLAGLSPNTLSMANTLLASLVAGGLGVLAGSLTQLNAVTLPLQVIPALAAALFARFTSFWIACAAGLLIGMATSELSYLSTLSWFPKDQGHAMPGINELFIFVVIVIAMFVRGASLPGRGELVEKRLPLAPRPERLVRPAVIGTVLCGLALVLLPFDFRQALTNSMIGAALILSVIAITGFLGQISAAQLALSGVSGLVLSRLATEWGIEFPLAPLIAAAVVTVLGLIIAVSALRVRGVSLAVVTLAGAIAIEQFIFVNSTWGGGLGGSPVPQPELLGVQLGTNAPFRGRDGKLPSPIFGFVVLGTTVALCLLVAALRRSALGQRMLAVRSNERAAAAAGINVRYVKLSTFAIGSFIAAIAGALYAYNYGSISATRFSALNGLSLIALAYLGGVTMVAGAIFAGLITPEGLFPHIFDKWVLPDDKVGPWTAVVAGGALVLTLIVNPDGIAGSDYAKRQRKMKQKALAAGAAAKPGQLAVPGTDAARTPEAVP
jgi:branched-subunit amino acid ABC-type transport system permease component